jgi:hypothetical protein
MVQTVTGSFVKGIGCGFAKPLFMLRIVLVAETHYHLKGNPNTMNTKQLKDVIAQIEALKTPESSADYQAGVDAAKAVVNTIVQESLDRERMQKLEQELAELRAKYPDQAAPKKRGRKPKAVDAQEAVLLEAESG